MRASVPVRPVPGTTWIAPPPDAEGAADSRRPSGFTLIEMLVVLAILGAASAIVVARGAWHSDTVDVRAAADEVAEALRTSRADAFRLDEPVTLRIDAQRGLLLFRHGPERRLPRGVAVTAVGRSSAPVAFEFQPDGACNGGAVRLSEGRVRRLVAVDFLSGRVSITP